MNHIWRSDICKLTNLYNPAARFYLICENCGLIKIGWRYNQVNYKIPGDVSFVIDDGPEFEPSCAEIIMTSVLE